MARLTDRTYLLGQQYKDPGKLQARIHLHARFSTNPTGWHRWVFQQLDLPGNCTILEVGCGPGHLWRENRDRIPPAWQILLTDFSTGMAATAASHLQSLGQIQSAVQDVQALALPDETFDAVVANHMLYHIPDKDRALTEIWRVLKSGGRFFAATNGHRHLLELREFVRSVDFEEGAVQQRWDAWVQVVENFSLENGLEVISRRFSAVELRRYDDSLVITEVDPIVAFLESSTILQVQPDKLGAFKRFLETEMAASGAIHITKDSGLFSAHKP